MESEKKKPNQISPQEESKQFEGGVESKTADKQDIVEDQQVDVKPGKDALVTPTKGKEPSKDAKDEEKKEELTEEEKKIKKEKEEKANAKAKEMLFGYLKQYRCLMYLGFLLNICGMVGEFVTPAYIGFVIDAITAKNFDQVNTLVIQWLIINGAGAVLSGLQRFIFQIITESIGLSLRQDVFEQIIRKDVAFFDARKTGDLISRLQSDTAKIENALATQASILFKSVIYNLIVLVMFFYLSWEMTVFTLGLMLPTMIFGPIYGKFMKRIQKEISDGKAAASNVAEEAFSNIRTVKAFATEERECISYEKQNNNIFEKAKQAAYAYGIFQCVMQFVMFGSLDALIYFAAYLNGNDRLSIGSFTAFQFYMFSFLMNFMMAASVLGEVMGVFGTTAAIAEIFLYEAKIKIEGGDKVTQDTLDDGTISLSDIKFTYPTKQDVQVIQKAEIKVAKNKTIALVGTSGCGKSTIIQLLERFYDPDQGTILFGKQDIKSLNPQDFKKHMAIVQQEPVLFSGTIRENIGYGLEKPPTDAELDEACRQANALIFVQDKTQFPLGYEQLVGERGIKLSGGQKQRIAIARAMIRKPKILLLDEATSALDADSEHQVQQALNAILENPESNQTVVVIAHRLSTIKDADEIVVLKRGNIVERGTHQELIDMNGVYQKLVERQLMSADN